MFLGTILSGNHLIFLVIVLVSLTFESWTNPKVRSQLEVNQSFLKFIGKVPLNSVEKKIRDPALNVTKTENSRESNPEDPVIRVLRVEKMEFPEKESEKDNKKPNVNLEVPDTKFQDTYYSLLSVILGKERFELVKHTIRNDHKLYDYLKAFPRRIETSDNYIQLYGFCSYLSPIFSCNISQREKVEIHPLQSPTFFPWIDPETSNTWDIIGGTYGSVVCGKFSGGSKKIFPYQFHSDSFFFSTYKDFKYTEYAVYLPTRGPGIEDSFKQLEPGKHLEGCVKVFRSASIPEYFEIWKDESFNLKWLERDTWISNLRTDDRFLKFTPFGIFLAPKKAQKLFYSKNPTLINQIQDNHLQVCSENCSNSIFYPRNFESRHPWNNISGKYWSSYLVMQGFIGPSFSDISSYLVLDSVIDWTKLSRSNLFLWSIAVIRLVYLFLSTIVSFTFSGTLVYQHCDLHANNLILETDTWEIRGDKSFSLPKNSSFRETILEIASSTIKNVKIIDLTYLTYFDAKKRNFSEICDTFGEVSISDIENWGIYLYNFRDEIEKVFSKNSDSLTLVLNPLSILTAQLEAHEEFNSIRPVFKGGSEFWWENWVFFGHEFNELYEPVFDIGQSFHEAVEKIETMVFGNITQLDLLEYSTLKDFPDPITFEIYLRELFYVPYSIMTFGTCIFKHEIISKEQVPYFLIAAETLTHFFLANPSKMPSPPPDWILKDQVGTKLLWRNCLNINPLFTKSISPDFPSEFYLEPCFSEFCIVKRPFPEKIVTWIQKDFSDRNFFFQISKTLLKNSSDKATFVLSVLIANQIRFNIKDYLFNFQEKFLEVSVSFAVSLISILKDVFQENRPVQGVQTFLSFCLNEFNKHLMLFIGLSSFNFGKKLCLKVYRAVSLTSGTVNPILVGIPLT
ncbi:Protein kinase-like domain containing protein [Cryptosporidium felis]|nr:Protein kinase-like domain containing protein [Cryptosporidium felis]